MISTVIDQSLGLEFPIFQGGMAWVADASLAARCFKRRRSRHYCSYEFQRRTAPRGNQKVQNNDR